MRQDENNNTLSANSELSKIWQELLGRFPSEANVQMASGEVKIPLLESDPWSALLKAKGTEVIDLQQLHLHMSDQDVERLLQIMQEQPAQNGKDEGAHAT